MTIRAMCGGAAFALPIALSLCLLGAAPARAEDPAQVWSTLENGTWDALRESVIGAAPMVVEGDALRLIAPAVGEDSAAVPVTIEVRRELGDVRELVLLVDHNPYPVILRARPGVYLKSLALRIRMQASSPVRVAARTADGIWHVAARHVQVSGGGCSEGGGSANAEAKLLGKVRLAAWGRTDGARLRFQVVHPMETGLARDAQGAFIPAYYVFRIDVNSGGRRLLALESTPIARNPTFTADMDVEPMELAALQVTATDSTQSIFLSGEPQLFLEPGVEIPSSHMSRN